MEAQADLRAIRRRIISLAHRKGDGHLSTALSEVELAYAALERCAMTSGRRYPDSFLLSKGHGALGVYAVMEALGMLPAGDLDSYNDVGSRYPNHPDAKRLPELQYSSGSLGHGLPFACGVALADRLNGRERNHFVLMGDGETQEGSVWEAAIFASARQLSRVWAFVDNNDVQAVGRFAELGGTGDLASRFRSFGWTAVEVDGHDLAAIRQSINVLLPERTPKAIIGKTTSGKGWAGMEDDVLWHYRRPSGEDLSSALEALEVEFNA